MYSALDRVKLVTAINPIQATSTRTGSAALVRDYKKCIVTIYLGFSLDSLSGSRYWTLKMQHSDNGSAFSDLTSADVDGGVTSYIVDDTTEDEAVYKFSYLGAKPYVRAVATPTGTHTNGTPMSANVLLIDPLFPTGV